MNTDDRDPQPNVSYSVGGSFGGTGQGLQGSVTASAGFAPAGPSTPADAPSPSGAGQASAAIKDVTTQSFMSDVMDASKAAPVIVDFWAPWCGPCQQLGPILEKVVGEARGAVTLCKMDIDKYPEIAGQMGIQSIPAVIAFVDGRPADAFMGAKGEQEVRAFVDKLVAANPTPEMADMAATVEEAGRLATEGDHGGAAELYGAVLAQEPGNLDALAGLGQCYVAVGETERAQALIDSVPEEHHNTGAIAGLVTSLALAEQAGDLGDIAGLAAAVDADPKDHQARFDYAVALGASGRKDEAVENLVAIVRADRKWNDDGAREKLVEFFEAWGHTDPATIAGRRMLSSVLFS